MGFPGGASGKENPPANTGDVRAQVRPLGWEDLLKKGMATHSSILAWRIPWTEEPGAPHVLPLSYNNIYTNIIILVYKPEYFYLCIFYLCIKYIT